MVAALAQPLPPGGGGGGVGALVLGGDEWGPHLASRSDSVEEGEDRRGPSWRPSPSLLAGLCLVLGGEEWGPQLASRSDSSSEEEDSLLAGVCLVEGGVHRVGLVVGGEEWGPGGGRGGVVAVPGLQTLGPLLTLLLPLLLPLHQQLFLHLHPLQQELSHLALGTATPAVQRLLQDHRSNQPAVVG